MPPARTPHLEDAAGVAVAQGNGVKELLRRHLTARVRREILWRTKRKSTTSAMTKLPPRYAFRLEDLRVWHEVEATCLNCRHRAVIDHARLTQGQPNYARLVDLEMKLRCRRCGRRGGHTITVLRPRD